MILQWLKSIFNYRACKKEHDVHSKTVSFKRLVNFSVWFKKDIPIYMVTLSTNEEQQVIDCFAYWEKYVEEKDIS